MFQKCLQLNWRQQRYRFNFKIGFSLLCLFFFILCCVLGVWQIQRYHYKKIFLTTYQASLTADPKPFLTVKNTRVHFQRVSVSGHYLNEHTMLLQNQFHHGQVGFDVLTPLKMNGEKKLLLVDRGWIAQSHDQTLPAIQSVEMPQYMTGYLKLIDERQFILGKNILNAKQSPIVMQKIDVNELNNITHDEFFPYVLRLDASADNGYLRDWTINTVVPERHMAYAAQWFLMAIVLMVAYLCFSYERVNK